MSRDWLQGKYTIINTSKYIGNETPIFRSSWEKRLMYFFDTNENVKRWGSEIIKLPYLYEVDNKIHTYITDFYAEIIDKNGDLKKYLIEVKPKSELKPPKPPKTNNPKAIKNYNYKMMTFIKNKNKWTTAANYAKQNGMIFRVVTEKDLGIFK